MSMWMTCEMAQTFASTILFQLNEVNGKWTHFHEVNFWVTRQNMIWLANCYYSPPPLKFNLESAIELSETANFVYNLRPYTSEQPPWHIWPTFTLNFFMRFSQKISLYFFFTMVQKKSRMNNTSNQGGGGGSCLFFVLFFYVQLSKLVWLWASTRLSPSIPTACNRKTRSE